MGIAYADGAEAEVLELIRQADDLSSTAIIGHHRYTDWAIRYHLCPERGNLFRHLDFGGLSVLEFGAGLGGATRVVAEQADTVWAVEGAEPRLEGLKARLRDLDNWQSTLANLQDFQKETKFDVVLMVGVLEYAGLYIKGKGPGLSPYRWVLEHAKSFLKPGGCVIVAIENRNGLKYWAGAPEDHTARMFDGIVGYPENEAPRTFSRKVLLELLGSVGLAKVEEFYPWPDYKTPSAMVSKRLIDRFPFFAAELAGDAMARSPIPPHEQFPGTLAVIELARSGLLHEMSNSFLMVASADGQSPTLRSLLRLTESEHEWAWHYSVNRTVPSATAFVHDGSKGLMVRKRTIIADAQQSPTQFQGLLWKPLAETKAQLEPSLSIRLRRLAYAGKDEEFVADLKAMLAWAFERWSADATTMLPEALDINATNVIPAGKEYTGFDIEWQTTEPFPKSWFIFRNLFTVENALAMFEKPLRPKLADLYEELCREFGVEPNLDGDILREVQTQEQTQRHVDAPLVRETIRERFLAPRQPATYAKDADLEARIRTAMAEGHMPLRQLAGLVVRNVRQRLTKDSFARLLKRVRPNGMV